jgi:hypothetical protein
VVVVVVVRSETGSAVEPGLLREYSTDLGLLIVSWSRSDIIIHGVMWPVRRLNWLESWLGGEYKRAALGFGLGEYSTVVTGLEVLLWLRGATVAVFHAGGCWAVLFGR